MLGALDDDEQTLVAHGSCSAVGTGLIGQEVDALHAVRPGMLGGLGLTLMHIQIEQDDAVRPGAAGQALAVIAQHLAQGRRSQGRLAVAGSTDHSCALPRAQPTLQIHQRFDTADGMACGRRQVARSGGRDRWA